MRRQLAVAVALLLACVPARGQTRTPVDWVFLVDTSKSMLEKGIFGEVQAALETFVRESSDGDSVAIYTFDRDVALRTSTPVTENRGDLYQIIRGLQATGNRTHLGAALEQGLARVKETKDRVPAVVLFTDGKEDVRGIENPVAIDASTGRALQSGAHVFFVSMNEHEPKLRTFPGAKFIEATDAAAIREAVQTIRTEIAPPPPPRPQPKPEVVAKPVPPEPPPSPLRKILLSVLALAILLATALIARAKLKERNRLEGELEIVKPRIPADAAFIGLPRLETSELALSAVVPLDALAGADARLFCRHKDGVKNVWIAASSGSLRVNDVETPMSELYDADTIQVGDAKLRFNRVGHERPQENP